MEIKEILEQVMAARGGDFLANDPLSFPRRYQNPEDREVAAFLSAGLAYGRVSMILRNLEDLFSRMPQGPAAFVRSFDPRRDSHQFHGFCHRFNSGQDLSCLCWLLRRALEDYGSLEALFCQGFNDREPRLANALDAFCTRMMAQDVSAIYGVSEIPPEASVRYFFPRPAGGSACKRLCMFLRWVCRPDDGVDLGLWSRVDPSCLVIPLDTHTARIARLLGWTRRKSANWKMALEVTQALSAIDPKDPVRFDFALAHLGISDGCSGKKGGVCVECPVAGLCAVHVEGNR